MTTQIIIKNANFAANAIGFVPPITTGLQQWFWLGGTAAASQTDRSGNGLNGTLVGSPTINANWVSFGGPTSNGGNGQYLATSIFDTGGSVTTFSVARSSDIFTTGSTTPKLWATYGNNPNYAQYPTGVSGNVGITVSMSATTGLPQCTLFLHDGSNNLGTTSGSSSNQTTGNLSITPVTSFKMYATTINVTGTGVTRTIYDLTDGTSVGATVLSPATRLPNVTNPFRIAQDHVGNGGITDIAFSALYFSALTTAQLNTVYAFVKNYLLNLRGISI